MMNKLFNYKKLVFPVIAVCIITVIAVAVCFLVGPSKNKESEIDGITVISSGCDYPDMSVEIIDAEFTGLAPYIKVKWKNSGDVTCVLGAEYDILKKYENKGFESTLTNNMWIHAANMIKRHGEYEKIYSIDYSVIPEEGTYRFESYFATEINGIRSENYTAYIEFTVESGVENVAERQFSMKEVVYDNGSFSALTKVENLPDIELSQNMILSIKTDGVRKEMGKFKEINLSKDNFDKRIWHSAVTDQISVADVRTENKRAWQLQVDSPTGESGGELYLLLEQFDGTLLLGYGEYYAEGLTQLNPDNSYLYWICSLEEKSKTAYPEADSLPDEEYAENYETIMAYAGTTDYLSVLWDMSQNPLKRFKSNELHLPLIMIASQQDYKEFTEQLGDILSLDESKEGYPSFFDATKNYSSAEFFEGNMLLVVHCQNQLGFVKRITTDDGIFTVTVSNYSYIDKGRYTANGFFAIIVLNRDAAKSIRALDAIYETTS